MRKNHRKTYPSHGTTTCRKIRIPEKEPDYSNYYRHTNVADQRPEWSWYMDTQTGIQPMCNGPSIFRYLVRNLAESSVSGVNRVASAKNGCQRLLWILVLGFCLGGFGYQTFEYMSIYYSKPSVVQIGVENNGMMSFPAVTFCNNNR